MVDTQSFTHDARVVEAVNRVKQACQGRDISDIIDRDGHQYVDLVVEGGGVLGIALTGYTYVLEQAGIRFLGVGGTSAGSINALIIAALGRPAEAKSERLVDILANIPIDSFIDGDSDARDFSKAVINKMGMTKLLWKASQVLDNFKEDLGLNPGEAFFNWLTGELRKLKIYTTADLDKNLASIPPGIATRDGRPLSPDDKRGRLAMVAADITTETKVEFPRMAELYWHKPAEINPAYFARHLCPSRFSFTHFV